MSYRPWLDGEALRQMGGLPPDALDVLVRTMARICEDPYDQLFSMAVRDEDPQERMAERDWLCAAPSRSADGHDSVLIIGYHFDRDLGTWLKFVVLEELPDGTAAPEVQVGTTGDVGLHRVGKTGVVQSQHDALPVIGIRRTDRIRREKAEVISHSDVVAIETAGRHAEPRSHP